MALDKKLFKQSKLGHVKEFVTVSLLDFFVHPDNDFLDEKREAQAFFDAILAQENRSAHRLSYFQPPANFKLFLKMNFSPDVSMFETEIVNDDDFVVFAGFDQGPCSRENGINGMKTLPRSTAHFERALTERGSLKFKPPPDWVEPPVAGV